MPALSVWRLQSTTFRSELPSDAVTLYISSLAPGARFANRTGNDKSTVFFPFLKSTFEGVVPTLVRSFQCSCIRFSHMPGSECHDRAFQE